MLRSYRLFTAFGIPIRIHGTLIMFLLVTGLLFGLGQGVVGILFSISLISAIFAFVLLHELGHSLVAIKHGFPVRQITLYPLGGIASLTEMPREPRVELQIAIAGPLVNLALAGLFGIAFYLLRHNLLAYLLQANLVLALFNLLPGFPMDGGRILRALLARRRPYLEATRTAGRVGQVVAIGMGIAGFVTLHFMLIFIAVFIYFAAQAEVTAVALRSRPLGQFGNLFQRFRDWDRPVAPGTAPFWASRPEPPGNDVWEAARGTPPRVRVIRVIREESPFDWEQE